jgi:pimeloyl-ACP methyl ester carboxylesterase
VTVTVPAAAVDAGWAGVPAATAHDAVRRADLHGRAVAYRQVGAGPVLLLVHGLGATMNAWDEVAPALASSCTVLTVDLPGHGRSAAPAGDYSLGAYASALRDLLDALGHRTATILGHSLGGGIAMQFAYQFPERTERLVLVASGGLGAEINRWLRAATLPGAELALRVAACRPLRWLRRRRLERDADAAGARRTFLRSLRAVADHRGQRAAATDRLYLLDRAPTMIVWGRRDDVIPVVHAERTHDVMANSRLEVFDGAGHCPHLDEPARFAALVQDFVHDPARRLPGQTTSAAAPANCELYRRA